MPAEVKYTFDSGVDTVDGTAWRVRTASGVIVIEGAEGLPVAIMLPDGKTVRTSAAVSGHERFAVSPGLYIVRVGREVRKVIVP